MVVIKVSGGLGNQLFQYAFGRYLAYKHNTKLKLDLQLNINRADFTPRSLGLSYFNIKQEFASEHEIGNFKYFTKGFLSKVERKFVQKFPAINKRLIVEQPSAIMNRELLADNCYYDGYWQTDYYFKPIEDILKDEFKLINTVLNKSNKNIYDSINKTNSVSLHIRRSDYISIKKNSSIFAVCDREYYNRAIDLFKKRIDNPNFYIFTDDADWAKENFTNDSFKIVTDNENEPHIDMYLMSNCKHNIIANSSFSWWGAWLNSNVDKIVVAPQNWYKNPTNNSFAINNILPKEWLKL